MNIKRILFWVCFIVVIALIVWGLIVAMSKAPVSGLTDRTPSAVSVDDHVRGPEDAVVILIEYSDFQCPACAAYYPLVERLLNESSTTLRLAYRHFPLYPLPHKNAFIASQASEAASIQGKFWEMYQILFEDQVSWEGLDDPRETFEKYAVAIGLDIEQYRLDLESESVKMRVERDRDEANALGVNSTPTFFVNGKAIPNPTSYESFKKTIDDAVTAASN